MRVSWETVAALAVVVTGATVALIFASPSAIEAFGALPWEAWAGIGASAAGIVGAAVGRNLVRKEGRK